MFLLCVDEFDPKVVIKDANRPPWIDRVVLQFIRKKNRIRRKDKLKNSAFYGILFAGSDSMSIEWLNSKSVLVTYAILVAL